MNEFQVHRLNERGLGIAEKFAEQFEGLLLYLDAYLPQGRERVLVVTKLQEACFFAKRTIAQDPQNVEEK